MIKRIYSKLESHKDFNKFSPSKVFKEYLYTKNKLDEVNRNMKQYLRELLFSYFEVSTNKNFSQTQKRKLDNLKAVVAIITDIKCQIQTRTHFSLNLDNIHNVLKNSEHFSHLASTEFFSKTIFDDSKYLIFAFRYLRQTVRNIFSITRITKLNYFDFDFSNDSLVKQAISDNSMKYLFRGLNLITNFTNSKSYTHFKLQKGDFIYPEKKEEDYEKTLFKHEYYDTEYKQQNVKNLIFKTKTIKQKRNRYYHDINSMKEFFNDLKLDEYSQSQKEIFQIVYNKLFNDNIYTSEEYLYCLIHISEIIRLSDKNLWNSLTKFSIFKSLAKLYQNSSVKYIVKKIMDPLYLTIKLCGMSILLGMEVWFGYTSTLQDGQEQEIIEEIKDLLSPVDNHVNVTREDLSFLQYIDQDNNIYRFGNNLITSPQMTRYEDYMCETNYYTDGSSGKYRVKAIKGSDVLEQQRNVQLELNKNNTEFTRNTGVSKTAYINIYGSKKMLEYANREQTDNSNYVYLKSERVKIRPVFASNFRDFIPLSRICNLITEKFKRCFNIFPTLGSKQTTQMEGYLMHLLSENERGQNKYLFLSTDYSNFDHTISYKLIKETTELLVNTIIQEGTVDERTINQLKIDLKVFDIIWKEKVIWEGHEFKYYDGMLSGWKVTNIIECFFNFIITIRVLKDMNLLSSHVFTVTMGDDNVTVLEWNKIRNRFRDNRFLLMEDYSKTISKYSFKISIAKSMPSFLSCEWLKKIFTSTGFNHFAGRQFPSALFKHVESSFEFITINDMKSAAFLSTFSIGKAVNYKDVLSYILENSKMPNFRKNVANIVNGLGKIKNKQVPVLIVEEKSIKLLDDLSFLVRDLPLEQIEKWKASIKPLMTDNVVNKSFWVDKNSFKVMDRHQMNELIEYSKDFSVNFDFNDVVKRVRAIGDYVLSRAIELALNLTMKHYKSQRNRSILMCESDAFVKIKELINIYKDVIVNWYGISEFENIKYIFDNLSRLPNAISRFYLLAKSSKIQRLFVLEESIYIRTLYKSLADQYKQIAFYKKALVNWDNDDISFMLQYAFEVNTGILRKILNSFRLGFPPA